MTRAVVTGNVRLDQIRFHPHNVRVDLGDLRDLTASIKQFGVLQPVVLEQYGDSLRIRTGHRRVAAAQLAGLTRIPAVVHPDALADDEWLRAAVHENTRRRDMDTADRDRAIRSMRDAGMTLTAIAADVGISITGVRRVLDPEGVAVADAKAKRKPHPPRLISAKRLRADLDEARAAVTAGDLDVWGVLARIEALIPQEATS